MRLRRTLPALLAAAALGLSTLAAQASTPPTGPRLFTPSHDVDLVVHQMGEEQWIEFNPAIYLKSRGYRFEIDVRRKNPRTPLEAVVHFGDRTRVIKPRYLDGWRGLRKAWIVTWKKPTGEVISQRALSWCPNDGNASRLSPKAAPTTVFTYSCGSHPFTKSHRWGIDRGWARQVLPYAISAPASIGDKAVLEVSLRKVYAQLFGIPESNRTMRFDVTVKHVEEPGFPEPDPVQRAAIPSGATSQRSQAPARPAAGRTPARSLPDLVALPAFQMATHHEEGRDLLDFGATVYNDGPGTLVVEGFRRGARRIMDAYQLFYRDDEPVGSRRVGTMAFDARDSHQHWHFKDFATYDLVDQDRRRLRTSGKEAFCLAPTDAIDLLAPGAVANPGNGDLSTACGDLTSVWVREVLAAGWGDTYTQQRAGQSIDVTGLPNGTYWVRVTANPEGRLIERTRANNVALRRIVLGGTPGDRTVRVPPVGLIDSEVDFIIG